MLVTDLIYPFKCLGISYFFPKLVSLPPIVSKTSLGYVGNISLPNMISCLKSFTGMKNKHEYVELFMISKIVYF